MEGTLKIKMKASLLFLLLKMYRTHNNKILAIYFLIFLLPALQCSGQELNFLKVAKITNVSIDKNGDIYTATNLETIQGQYNYLEDFNLWKGKKSNGCVFSFNKQTLGCFVVPDNLKIYSFQDYFVDGKPYGGYTEQPEGEILVQLPYFPNGKYADIFDLSGKKVLTIDLSSKATCNENDRCDRPIEDSENCPQDCKKNEPKIDPAVVQKATADQQAAQKAEKKISLADLGWWGIAILIILLAGGGIGYYIYRKNREN